MHEQSMTVLYLEYNRLSTTPSHLFLPKIQFPLKILKVLKLSVKSIECTFELLVCVHPFHKIFFIWVELVISVLACYLGTTIAPLKLMSLFAS